MYIFTVDGSYGMASFQNQIGSQRQRHSEPIFIREDKRG